MKQGHEGVADWVVRADTGTWLAFLRKDTSIISALLRRKIRLKGPPKLLLAFVRCFPS